MIENLSTEFKLDPLSKRISIKQFNETFDEVKDTQIEAELRGRLVYLRKLKTISFGVMQDQTGQAGLAFLDESLVNSRKLIKDLSLGDIIKVGGIPFLSDKGEKCMLVRDLETVANYRDLYPDKNKGLVDIRKRRNNFPLQLITDRESFLFFDQSSKFSQAIRENLNSLGFQEFETPVLRKRFQSGQAKPFVTYHNSLGIDVYMRPTSEIELIQLIASGYEKVYELGKAFRNEGMDKLHNPEYTTIEAYSAYTDYINMMSLSEFLIREAAIKAFERTTFCVNGNDIDLTKKWNQMTVDEGFKKFGGFSLLDIKDLSSLNKFASANGITVTGMQFSQGIGKLIEKIIVPRLIDPTFLKDFPVGLAPLGKSKHGDSSLTERAWACLGGISFADIATSLVDPDELQRKLIAQDIEVGREGKDHSKDPLVMTLKYGIPPTAGLGIGLNRILMVLGNRNTITETILYPNI